MDDWSALHLRLRALVASAPAQLHRVPKVQLHSQQKQLEQTTPKVCTAYNEVPASTKKFRDSSAVPAVLSLVFMKRRSA